MSPGSQLPHIRTQAPRSKRNTLPQRHGKGTNSNTGKPTTGLRGAVSYPPKRSRQCGQSVAAIDGSFRSLRLSNVVFLAHFGRRERFRNLQKNKLTLLAVAPTHNSGLLVNGAGARDGFLVGGIAKKPIDTPPDMLAQHKHHKRALPARRGPLFGDHFRSSSRCLFLLSFLSLRRARRAFITFLFRFECGGRGGSFDDNGVLLFLFGSVVSFSDLKQKMDAATRAIDKGRLRKLRLSPLQAGGLALPPLLVSMLSRGHRRMENIHQKKHQKKNNNNFKKSTHKHTFQSQPDAN